MASAITMGCNVKNLPHLLACYNLHQISHYGLITPEELQRAKGVHIIEIKGRFAAPSITPSSPGRLGGVGFVSRFATHHQCWEPKTKNGSVGCSAFHRKVGPFRAGVFKRNRNRKKKREKTEKTERNKRRRRSFLVGF